MACFVDICQVSYLLFCKLLLFIKKLTAGSFNLSECVLLGSIIVDSSVIPLIRSMTRLIDL